MFGSLGNMHKLLKEFHETKSFPEIEVSEDEFVRLMIESGTTKEKAEFHARISKGLGSSVRIGQQLVKIKKASP